MAIPTALTRRLAAVWFADLVGYVRLSAETAAERLEMVWQLTLQALAFREEMQDEPGLRRDIVRILRGRR